MKPTQPKPMNTTNQQQTHYQTGRGTLCSLDNDASIRTHTADKSTVTCGYCLNLLAQQTDAGNTPRETMLEKIQNAQKQTANSKLKFPGRKNTRPHETHTTHTLQKRTKSGIARLGLNQLRACPREDDNRHWLRPIQGDSERHIQRNRHNQIRERQPMTTTRKPMKPTQRRHTFWRQEATRWLRRFRKTNYYSHWENYTSAKKLSQ